MSNAIYIATNLPYSGKSVLSLGLLNLLAAKTKRVGYFKPIIYENIRGGHDYHIQMIAKHFHLAIPYEDMYAFSREEVLAHRAAGNEAYVIDTIIEKFKKLEDQYDFVVVEGTDFLKEGVSFEFDANIQIAKNLGIPAILLAKGEGNDAGIIANQVMAFYKNFVEKEVKVIAAVVNKIQPDIIPELSERLTAILPKELLVSLIPANKNLSNPTMKEIFYAIGGRILIGSAYLGNQVDKSIVGAMQLHNLLPRIAANTLVVTPGDRGDIILASLQANSSANYPNISGIVLTGGIEPEPSILQLIEGLEQVVPIIQVETGTFETVQKISLTQSVIAVDNQRKIQLAIHTFEQFVDAEGIAERISTFKPIGITPHMFQYQLVKRARQQVKHIVLAEGNDARIIAAALRLLQQGIVKLTVLGDELEVSMAFKKLGLTLPFEGLTIINPLTSPKFNEYATTLFELRKAKHLTRDMASDLMADVSYFGTMMVYVGDADGMVSGAIHTTQHTIRPALQFIKTKPGIQTVSSVFFMCLEDRVCVFGDCAVNPNPSAEQLAEIAISSAESSAAFGIVPLVAMLSYSSGNSGEGIEVDKVRTATNLVKSLRPDILIEGPIQYDAAVDAQVGKQKMPNSPVAGQANVLIFPDLNTGNNTYKAVQRETGALAIGPMLQGLNKPVNDLSRGCTVEDIFNTVLITAIQAQGQ